MKMVTLLVFLVGTSPTEMIRTTEQHCNTIVNELAKEGVKATCR